MANPVPRGLAAAALAALPVFAPSPAHAAEMPLADAVASLPMALESRDGYDRNKFRHWNTGNDPADGCNTRAEVLLHEAVDPPAVGAGCRLTGGSWFSYYDATAVTSASSLDIDHMVPLAEAWDSGASNWTSQRREAYANDQGAEASLVAVTARSNRSKADQDPAQWMPPVAEVHCRYIGEWVGTKLRWGLAVDDVELAALKGAAASCPEVTVTYDPPPSRRQLAPAGPRCARATPSTPGHTQRT